MANGNKGKDDMSAKSLILLSAMAGALVIGGCASGSNVMMPSTDKDLRHSKKTLAKEATSRPYPATAPTAEKSAVQGEIDYQLNVINLINLGESDWSGMVVWVNGKYSAPLGLLPAKQQRGIPFSLFFDENGNRAPNKGVWVETVDVLYNGTMYRIRTHLAD